MIRFFNTQATVAINYEEIKWNPERASNIIMSSLCLKN